MLFKKKQTVGTMTAEIRVRRCYGCGSILQDTDPNDAGYIPKEKFEDEKENLCERCYRLRHYSIYKETPDLSLDYVTILEHAKEEGALAVYVINAFALHGSFLEGIGAHLPDNVLVVINKRDLLPPNYSDDFLISSVKENLRKEDIHPQDVLVTSASQKGNMDKLIQDIDRLRKGKSVYFVGAYQVGKSSLINSLLMAYTNSTDKMITTSPYPGTTLDVISIPLDENTFIYDTPGIYNSKSIISFLEPKIVKFVQPRSLVKVEGYGAKEGQSFAISNLARIDLVKGGKTDFLFYKSNDLPILRSKIQKGDALIESVGTSADTNVRSEKIRSMSDLVSHDFKINSADQMRIIINGLGFIDFRGNGQEIRVYAPKNVEVKIIPLSVRA